MRYRLARSTKRKTIALAVYPDGQVVVRAPQFSGLAVIERFVSRHSGWIRERVKQTRGRHVVRIPRRDIAHLKKSAHLFTSQRAERFARFYGVSFKKISIRAQRSRWGSCSKAGNLSFNYRIMALPREIADYIIVHEICHLLAFDHSRVFWDFVEKTVPDHRERRKRLRNTAFIFI